MRDDFAIFILSHGRPNRIYTVDTLIKQGYTGKYYFILDDTDATVDEYARLFGEEHILIFNKEKVSKEFDIMDNLYNNKVVVYARNVCFDIAKDLKLNYFLELEDDYLLFEFREQKDRKLLTHKITDLDTIFNYMIEYLDTSNALAIAFAQGGDMIGGINSAMWKSKLRRKAMNTFFCKTSRPFTFIGRMNDDVNTYTTLGSRGELFLTIANIDIIQVPTQSHTGGNSEAYLQYGTFLKSFYSVIAMPSCIKIDMMGVNNKRIHHNINWDATVPKIISSKFRLDK